MENINKVNDTILNYGHQKVELLKETIENLKDVERLLFLIKYKEKEIQIKVIECNQIQRLKVSKNMQMLLHQKDKMKYDEVN